jgi:hypothetical protein
MLVVLRIVLLYVVALSFSPLWLTGKKGKVYPRTGPEGPEGE